MQRAGLTPSSVLQSIICACTPAAVHALVQFFLVAAKIMAVERQARHQKEGCSARDVPGRFCSCRDDDKAGYFEMNISTLDGETGPDVICAEAETVRPLVGDLQKRRFQFRPPGQIRWHTFFRKQVRQNRYEGYPCKSYTSRIWCIKLDKSMEIAIEIALYRSLELSVRPGVENAALYQSCLLFVMCTPSESQHKQTLSHQVDETVRFGLKLCVVCFAAAIRRALAEPAELPHRASWPGQVSGALLRLLFRGGVQRPADAVAAAAETAAKVVSHYLTV